MQSILEEKAEKKKRRVGTPKLLRNKKREDFIPLATVKRIAYSVGAGQVKDDAVELVRAVVEQICRDIWRGANRVCKNASRSRIKREDVETALELMGLKKKIV